MRPWPGRGGWPRAAGLGIRTRPGSGAPGACPRRGSYGSSPSGAEEETAQAVERGLLLCSSAVTNTSVSIAASAWRGRLRSAGPPWCADDRAQFGDRSARGGGTARGPALFRRCRLRSSRQARAKVRPEGIAEHLFDGRVGRMVGALWPRRWCARARAVRRAITGAAKARRIDEGPRSRSGDRTAAANPSARAPPCAPARARRDAGP